MNSISNTPRSIMRAILAAAVCVSAVTLANAAGAATYTTIDPAGSNATIATAINKNTYVTGFWVDATNVQHGFEWPGTGAATSFDPTGSVKTTAQSINTANVIAGYYQDSGGAIHGFIRPTKGGIKTYNAACGSAGTWINSITDKNAIAGTCFDGTRYHGFIVTSQGVYASFDPTGSANTYALSIDHKTTLTGNWIDSTNQSHGYVRAPNSVMYLFDPPGSTGTYPQSINYNQDVTGYFASGSTLDGFLRLANGTITSFQANGDATYATSLNTSDVITGFYYDGTHYHGYVGSAGGTLTKFDVPGALDTNPESINDGSQIAGYYKDSGGAYHGFERSP